jgi:hypothetical protein
MTMGATATATAKGILFGVSLLLTSLLGVLCFSGPLLPIFFLYPPLYRYLFDFFLAGWLHNTAVSACKCNKMKADLIFPNARESNSWLYFSEHFSAVSYLSVVNMYIYNYIAKYNNVPGCFGLCSVHQ